MSDESPASLAGSTDVFDERVLVLDFGSQYAQLIARRVREQNVYAEIVRHDISPARLRAHRPRGIILSGGPGSVYEHDAPRCHPEILQMGICYGMQLVCEALGRRPWSGSRRFQEQDETSTPTVLPNRLETCNRTATPPSCG